MIQHLIDTHFHLDHYKDHQKIYAELMKTIYIVYDELT